MRRGAVFESFQEEAEAPFCFLFRKPEGGEHFTLHVAAMNTDGARSELYPIQHQVIELSEDEIRPVPDFGTSVKMDYLIGMAQSGRKFALLLDVDKVLTTKELHDLSMVTDSAENAGPEESGGEDSSISHPMEAEQNVIAE